MRHVALVSGVVIALWTRGAAAQVPPPGGEPPRPSPPAQAELDALVSEGEALAKAGQFSAAIERWKRADRVAPRARHACLIGLAYTRRELWPQAEIFFAACRQRATADDPVPAWLPAAERELHDKLAQTPVAAVTLAVEPATADARFKVSSFAPDEVFGPRVIHLTLGQHTITATAEGHAPATRTIDIDSTGPRTVVIQLDDDGPPDGDPPPDRIIPVGHGVGPAPRTRKSVVPWVVIGAGGALAVGGGIYHGTALRGAWRDLEATTDPAFYQGEGDRAWRSARRTTIILYSAAAATIATGVVLRALGVGDRREAPVAIGVTAGDGGGVLTIGWRAR